MHSDGSPTRTFCYSADAVSGYFKVLVRGRDGRVHVLLGPLRDLGELHADAWIEAAATRMPSYGAYGGQPSKPSPRRPLARNHPR